MSASKKWVLLAHDTELCTSLAKKAKISPVIAQLLINRGIDSPENAYRFLNPVLKGLHDPALLPGALDAATLILQALKTGKVICVYGDYDADGISGTAILIRLLRILGGNPRFYVPKRLEEGYGLNSNALESLARSGVQQVITVDCGIASIEEAKIAKTLNIELIITDHHEMKATIPEAAAVVHPRLPGGTYPFGELSGSAVALKLAWMIAVLHSGNSKVEGFLRDFLVEAISLASLGIVADVVPLLDENRILVRSGLERLTKSANFGLQAMVKESNLNEKRKLNSTDIGFNLAPKLNAAGRIGCAQLVVDLLITNRMDQAREIALFLSDQNKQRQKIERQILTEAKELAESEEFLHDPFLVLAGTTWHPGIVGVVAGRLTEEFGKPCIVLAPPVTSSSTSDTSTEEEPLQVSPTIWSGSGRSGGMVKLHELLAECESLVVRAGGHAAAAGLQIEKDKIPLLRQKLCQLVKEKYPTGIKPAKLILDAEVPLSALTHSLVKDLDQLEPYGMGNKKPIYLATNLTVEKEPTLVGTDGLHLRFQVSQAGVKLWAIAFRMGKRKEELMSNGGAISLAFTPKLNEWNGFTTVSLEVVDFQPLQNPDLE